MASLWMLYASFAFAAMGAGVKLASEFYSTSELLMYRGLIGTLILLFMVRRQGGTFKTDFGKAHLWRSLVGVTMVLQPAVESNQWLGGLAGVCSSMISAMAYMQVRKLGQLGEPEYRVVFYFSLTTTLVGLSATLAGDGPQGALFHAHTPYGFLLLLGIGGAALIAQMCMTRAYRVGKVLVVANLQYTGIVFSTLWGLILWGDAFDWHVWLGIGVILLSGLAATFYNTRKTARGAIVKDQDPVVSES